MAASDHFLLFCNADGHCLWATVNVFRSLKNVIDVASSQVGRSSCLIDFNTEIMVMHTHSNCRPVCHEGALPPPRLPLPLPLPSFFPK